MKTDQIYVDTAAVFCNFQQVDHAVETGVAREFGSDIRERDCVDSINLDVAVFHRIVIARNHSWPLSDADARGDLAVAYGATQAFGELHGLLRPRELGRAA